MKIDNFKTTYRTIRYNRLMAAFFSLTMVLSSFTAGVAGITPMDNAELIPPVAETPSSGLSLLVPYGGEVWKGGYVLEIVWDVQDGIELSPDSINIYYSIDGGMEWTMIAEKESDDASFNWTLPFITSDKCLVKVQAMDAAGNELSVVSDSGFMIDSILPSVKVRYPNGGDVWKGGIVEEIQWSATDNYLASAATIDIFYSINGGLDWALINDNEPNDGSYSWAVSLETSEDCQIRINATDVAGNVNYDLSDGLFTIESTAPTVIVTSPNGGEMWLDNSAYDITWMTYDNFDLKTNTVTIYYSVDSGKTWLLIAENEPNDGQYNWKTSDIRNQNCLVKVEVLDAAGNIGYDMSDGEFCVGDQEFLLKSESQDEINYTPHAPIRIDSNADFDAAHGVSGGNGIEADPWIIENWEIDGANFGYCLYIGNTTDYFIVRNLILNNASGVGSYPFYSDSGLILYNVINGKVESNTLINNEYGMILTNSNSNHLLDNIVLSNTNTGIYLDTSDNNNIENNNCSDSINDDGITLYSSDDNDIIDNQCYANKYYGVNLTSSQGNFIENNSCILNIVSGIYLFDSDMNIIQSNNCSKSVTYHGICIDGNGAVNSDQNTIQDNHCYNNNQHGI
ncbi:MAG: right-handed parallel beta-helix repeat-containing protein, partial [Thermoplasmata archaeon]|nr:right-handed parallel beta-helix repeat-containing protein [Thermoplasmata archaeon]